MVLQDGGDDFVADAAAHGPVHHILHAFGNFEGSKVKQLPGGYFGEMFGGEQFHAGDFVFPCLKNKEVKFV